MAEKVAGARNMLPESDVIGLVRDGIASSPDWDRRMTKEEFENEFLKISNREIDMYKVKPCRVGVRSSGVS
ncbi:MAG: hypothetical protein H7833_15165 [Magnetococcus sp. DMHC-1]|nr:hypothetical protein [Magnetococcales bacterium]